MLAITDWCKNVIEVHAFPLHEALGYQSGVVPLHVALSMQLLLEDPCDRDCLDTLGLLHWNPSAVGLQGRYLLIHSKVPLVSIRGLHCLFQALRLLWRD